MMFSNSSRRWDILNINIKMLYTDDKKQVNMADKGNPGPNLLEKIVLLKKNGVNQ